MSEKFLDRIDELNNTINKGNMLSPPMSSDEAIYFLRSYLLGKDWYTIDPLSKEQTNTEIVYDILRKYSKRYKKEQRRVYKAWKKRK